MNTIAILFLVILAPIILFLGWFARSGARWMLFWGVFGAAICGGLLIKALNAPSMDWGYTMGLFWLWLAFFVCGGLVQLIRYRKAK